MVSNMVGLLLKILGWAAIAVALIFVIYILFDGIDGAGIAATLLFLIPGITFAVCGNKMRKSAKVKKYIDLVINQKITSIDNIALAFPSTQDKVRRELQGMLNEGYFPNGYIDDARNMIVLSPKTEYQETVVEEERTNAQPGHFKCTSCGAVVSAAAERKGECEYCGSVMKNKN